MGKIPVFKKIGDVYVKICEVNEQNLDWLKDEPDMEILAVYVIDELEDGYPAEDGRRVYEFRAEL